MSGWTEKDYLEYMAGRNAAAMPIPALPKAAKPRMNKWESEYAQMLEVQRIAGEIRWYEFEGIRLRLAVGTNYTPDFAVVDKDGLLECHEVKGFWREAGLVRFNVAAEKFPFLFIAMRKKKVKEGGGWEAIRYVNNRRLNA